MAPHNQALRIKLAETYEAAGRYDKAEAAYKDAVKNSGPKRDILDGLGEMYYRLGAYGPAEKTFNAAVMLYNDDYKAYDYLGMISGLKNNDKEALYYFTLSVLSNRKYAPAYFHRALIHRDGGRREKAEEDMLNAAESGFDIPEEFIIKI